MSAPAVLSPQTRATLLQYVTADPLRMGGEPVFRGTRVPVRSLFGHLKAGDTLEAFLSDFPGVTREQAEAVIGLAATGLVEGLSAA
jgi:uncharacterized protein (DUF433 family)